MDEAGVKKLVRVVQDADSVDGQLENFKKHCKKAAAEAQNRFKTQGKDVPSWALVGKDLTKLDKATAPALKAVESMNKFVGDQKKLQKMEMADAKKQMRAYLLKIKPADDAASSVLVSVEKVFKELGLRESGTNIPLKLMAEKYTPFFLKYYANLKMNINKL